MTLQLVFLRNLANLTKLDHPNISVTFVKTVIHTVSDESSSFGYIRKMERPPAVLSGYSRTRNSSIGNIHISLQG